MTNFSSGYFTFLARFSTYLTILWTRDITRLKRNFSRDIIRILPEKEVVADTDPFHCLFAFSQSFYFASIFHQQGAQS